MDSASTRSRDLDEAVDHQPAPTPTPVAAPAAAAPPRPPPTAVDMSPHGIFLSCPHCSGQLQPEHAHYRCRHCGWRDSCCD